MSTEIWNEDKNYKAMVRRVGAKEMSAKELVLTSGTTEVRVRHGTDTGKFGIQVTDDKSSAVYMLNRNQAHLLMLYLQEHLK